MLTSSCLKFCHKGQVHLYSREWEMTDDERTQLLIALIKQRTKEALVSKKASRDLLIATGIYTKKGKLRVAFGGESRKKPKAA